MPAHEPVFHFSYSVRLRVHRSRRCNRPASGGRPPGSRPRRSLTRHAVGPAARRRSPPPTCRARSRQGAGCNVMGTSHLCGQNRSLIGCWEGVADGSLYTMGRKSHILPCCSLQAVHTIPHAGAVVAGWRRHRLARRRHRYTAGPMYSRDASQVMKGLDLLLDSVNQMRHVLFPQLHRAAAGHARARS